MIETVYGTDRFLVTEKVNEIIEEIKKKHPDAERWGFNVSDPDFIFGKALQAYETVSLFQVPRIVVIHVEQEKELLKIDEKELARIVSAPGGEFSYLILALPKRYLTKNPLKKLLEKNTREYAVGGKEGTGKNANARLDSALRKRTMTMEVQAKNLFVERIGVDLARMETELDKLRLLDSNITLKMVDTLISSDLSRDIFALGNALLAKEKDKAFSVYHSLLQQKNDPLSLAPLIAATLRSIYQVETLINLNYSSSKIKNTLKMSDGQYWNITQRQVGKVSDILSLLNELAVLDQSAKLGEVDRFIAFEMMMIKVMA